MIKEPKKIQNSIYKKFILDCIEKGLTASEIEKQLLKKGIKLTSPTIRTYIKYVKQQGINVTQFKEQAETNALQLNDKIKNFPELTTIFSRRNYLAEQLLERRNKVLQFVNEGKRSNVIFDSLISLQEELLKIKPKLEESEFQNFRIKFDFLRNYINANFLKDSIYPK